MKNRFALPTMLTLVIFHCNWSAAGCVKIKPLADNTWKTVSYDTKIRYADLDDDGIKEKITRIYSAGSGASMTTLKTRLSKSGKKLEIDYGGNYAEFFTVTPIPTAIAGPANRKLRARIEQILFHQICTEPDPSAKHLLVRLRLHENSKLNVDTAVWHAGPPVMPDTYTVVLQQKSATKLFASSKIKTASAWFSYFGHNHRRLHNARMGANRFWQLYENRRYRLLGTAHGVVLHDKAANRHAWKWVFTGGYKLRWPSLINARLGKNGKVTVNYKRPPLP